MIGPVMAVPPDSPPGVSLRRPEPSRGEQESIDHELIELLCCDRRRIRRQRDLWIPVGRAATAGTARGTRRTAQGKLAMATA
jgi:hypothetical protein